VSGGSYNYLCFHTDNLTEYRGDLDEMAKRLNGLPWAEDAAAATRRVQELLEQAYQAAEELSEVWRAVEWWDSCDWGEDQVREEIAAYRAKRSVAGEETVPNNQETT
jgi:hypothetical protein